MWSIKLVLSNSSAQLDNLALLLNRQYPLCINCVQHIASLGWLDGYWGGWMDIGVSLAEKSELFVSLLHAQALGSLLHVPTCAP